MDERAVRQDVCREVRPGVQGVPAIPHPSTWGAIRRCRPCALQGSWCVGGKVGCLSGVPGVRPLGLAGTVRRAARSPARRQCLVSLVRRARVRRARKRAGPGQGAPGLGKTVRASRLGPRPASRSWRRGRVRAPGALRRILSKILPLDHLRHPRVWGTRARSRAEVRERTRIQ